MRVRCPHCSQPIELVPELESKSIVCPSCGSEIGLIGADEPTATLPIGEMPVLEHFELIEEVGMGQFGRVWKARDLELRRVVAIKVPHKRNLSTQESGFFLREARSAAKLNHPNIVSVYEVGIADGNMYIVSEFIDGPTMRLWRDLRKPSPEEAARVCMATALALDYAHNQGIVHRDLKPSNIILDDLGEPHITDFGLAKQEGAEATIAITGHVIGTPAYMAPEQIRDGHQAERRSDVYSLGVILYELIAGIRPFKGGRRILFQQVLYDDPQPPRAIKSNVPKDLQTICLKALEKKPADRYETAAEFAEDLRRFLAGTTIKAKPTPVAVRAARWARRRPAAVSSALLLLLVLLLVPLALRPRLPSPTPDQPRQPTPIQEIRGPMTRITTEPAGAQVVMIPVDRFTGDIQVGKSIDMGNNFAARRVPPGWYLCIARNRSGTMFHEVYRFVPESSKVPSSILNVKNWSIDESGAMVLHSIKLFPQAETVRSMVRVTGGELVLPDGTSEYRQRISIPDFFIDDTVVTYEMLERYGLRPPQSKEELKLKSTHPVVEIDWWFAAHYAELMGKRLPYEPEYLYLETAGGTRTTTESWPSAAGPIPATVDSQSIDRLEWDRLTEPILGVRSNVSEWTNTWSNEDNLGTFFRRIRGGAVSMDGGDKNAPLRAVALSRSSKSRTVGFRCARSLRPRVAQADYPRPTTNDP